MNNRTMSLNLAQEHHAFFMLDSFVTLPVGSANKMTIQRDVGQVKMDK
jgi:hypothetical protein